MTARRRLVSSQPNGAAGLAECLQEWAKFDRALGRYAEADQHLAEALTLQRRFLRPGDPAVAETLEQGAILQDVRGQKAAARQFYQDALRMRLAVFGENHIFVARTRNNLAQLLAFSGQPAMSGSAPRRGTCSKRA